MELKKNNIPTIFLFLITTILIAYFFPREGLFRYQFYEGKPWRYGLLTAPQDFPIYKSTAEVEAEKDSVLKNFSPYYRLNPDILEQQKEKLREAYTQRFSTTIPAEYMQYIEKSLTDLYQHGIIATTEFEKLQKDKINQVNLLESNVAQLYFASDFFTIKTAYEFIINNAPAAINKNLLQSCNINDYLTENISYDSATTDKVKEELLKSVPIANGMVQAGERIVDRGEIIDNHTYNVLRSLKIIHESQSEGGKRQNLIIAGQFTYVLGIMLCFWLYLFSFRPKLLERRRDVLFLLLCILLPSLLAELCISLSLFNLYIIPFGIVPIVIRTFFDSRTAMFTHLMLALLCSLMAPFPFEFLSLQIIAGMVAIFSLKELSQRSQLISSAFFIFLAYALGYLSMTVYQEADLSKINWNMLLYFGINFILLMFAYVLVYFLEKTFGYISSITLVELSNINTPLLKKLSETAPGTFQHSLQVSILASAAAAKIGANSQLVRTGAMYHDIGKMTNPAFFTENQTSVNPHNQLPFEESAQIIIGHVTEGVKLAEKAMLPEAIIDFIRTHHGKGKVKYFYNSFKNKYPDREVDESLFTYPGPNPFTQETAIVMMADVVEATSRSLKEHTEEGISELVNRLIDSQLEDGLLKNAPLTFRDVEEVKQVFIEKLKTMYHTRISYPELKK
ncbi:HDIG domain-containing metalloprotein [Massilibacteroides sp.]|uniref:HD family phosphohydrolase n=1 Tax=Massilibacteroides sp. TaxID=2034766 RepID=UPI002628EBDE|nr:HDIG domain-containing metalloprotein [Massilibacteroides sp.]MDD4516777.1 HDIG domain-containing protein [Massilibacteroides sp.]